MPQAAAVATHLCARPPVATTYQQRMCAQPASLQLQRLLDMLRPDTVHVMQASAPC